MRYRPMLIAASLVLAPLAGWADEPAPSDMVNNPPFASWSSFKPGTSVTQKETVKLADGTKVVIDKTFKLVKKTKDSVTVEADVRSDAGGFVQSETTLTTFPAKVKKSDVDTPDDKIASVTEGKEEVDLKGKKVEAEWVEATDKSGDQTVIAKIWTVKEVPGGIVKQTIVQKKGDAVVSESVLELGTFK